MLVLHEEIINIQTTIDFVNELCVDKSEEKKVSPAALQYAQDLITDFSDMLTAYSETCSELSNEENPTNIASTEICQGFINDTLIDLRIESTCRTALIYNLLGSMDDIEPTSKTSLVPCFTRKIESSSFLKNLRSSLETDLTDLRKSILDDDEMGIQDQFALQASIDHNGDDPYWKAITYAQKMISLKPCPENTLNKAEFDEYIMSAFVPALSNLRKEIEFITSLLLSFGEQLHEPLAHPFKNSQTRLNFLTQMALDLFDTNDEDISLKNETDAEYKLSPQYLKPFIN